MAKRFPIHRTRIGRDIVAEFAVPPTKRLQKSSRVAVLAQGMPTKSSKASFMEFLARKGFYVVAPQYRGAWESRGEFLKDEPTKDIEDVITFVAHKRRLLSIIEEVAYDFPQQPSFYIFAGSFGGPAGMLLSKHPQVRAVVGIAPVVDWTMKSKAEPLDKVYMVAKGAFGEGYRFSKKNWNKLGRNDFYDPMKRAEEVDGSKIIIFHAKDDESVPYRTVERFSKKVGAKTYFSSRGGHISMSELEKPAKWRSVKKFLESLEEAD